MDSFTLTDQEKQLLSKEKRHFKYLIKMAKSFCLSSWKEKTFSAIQIALNEKEPWNHKENTSSFYDANSGNLLVVTAKMSTTIQVTKLKMYLLRSFSSDVD